MEYDPIIKTSEGASTANLRDYDTACADFSWDDARRLIDGLPEGGLNIAHEAIDRHVLAGYGAQVALRWISKSGDRMVFTYQELSELTNRFANVLRSCGLEKGARIFSLLGRLMPRHKQVLGHRPVGFEDGLRVLGAC